MLARLHHGLRPPRGVDVEAQHHHAVVEVPLHLVPGLGEDRDHLAVLGQHLGGEAPDAVLTGGGGQVLEQDGTDAAALVVVRDVEGDLGLVRVVEAVVAADADDVRAAGDDEGHAVAVVHLREALELLRAELGLVREEAQVDGVLRLADVERLDRVRVQR